MIDLGIGFDVPQGIARRELADRLKAKSLHRDNKPVEDVLQTASRGELLAAIAEVHHIPYIPGLVALADKKLLADFDALIMRRASVIPISVNNQRLIIAISNPYRTDWEHHCAEHYNRLEVVPVMVQTSEIEAELDRQSNPTEIDTDAAEEARARIAVSDTNRVWDIGTPLQTVGQPDNVPPELVRRMIADAITAGASDIHLTTEADRFYYLYRVNGMCGKQNPIDPKFIKHIDARIMTLAGVHRDAAVDRVGIEGRFTVKNAGGRKIDCRYERMRTLRGYHVTIRLHDKSTLEPRLGVGSLAFDRSVMLHIHRALHAANGIIPVSGPTGMGKSTTLGAMLRELNNKGNHIITLDHPVEDEIPGVTHCDMDDPDHFLEYFSAVMRSDPDVIQVGEIRDKTSATLAVNAALSGHRVLTSIHANSAADILDRLLHMGVGIRDLARTIRLLCAQRLVRIVCPECARWAELTHQHAELFPRLSAHIGTKIRERNPEGCSRCGEKGHIGRKAIMEVLPVDEDGAKLLISGASLFEFESAVRTHYGLKTLAESAIDLLISGTSDLLAIEGAVNLN